MMPAVILAAGEGSRARSICGDRPKGFICLGGQPIIERSLRQLVEHGISNIVIVAGYRAEYYDVLARRWPGVRVIRNDRYAETGSMYSLYQAREYISGPFLVLDSDIIYEDRALRELLELPRPNAILLSGVSGLGDEVWAEVSDSRLRAISRRKADLQNVYGEMMGIVKMSQELLAILTRYGEERFQHDPQVTYEDCLVSLAQDVELFCHKIDDLLWAEIDDEEQFAQAQSQIFPRILERESEPS